MGSPIDLSSARVNARVFISHASADAPSAQEVCRELEARNIPCWIAPRDIVSGERYPEALIRAIREAGLLLLLHSKHANQSNHVAREVERAAARGVPILCVKIEDAPVSTFLEYFLSSYQWLNAIPIAEFHEAIATAASRLLSRKFEQPRASVDAHIGDVADHIVARIQRLPRAQASDAELVRLAEDLFRRPAFYSHPERAWDYALYAIVRTRVIWEQEVLPRLGAARKKAAAAVLAELLTLEDFHAEAIGLELRDLTEVTARCIHAKQQFIRRIPRAPTGNLRERLRQRSAALKKLRQALSRAGLTVDEVGQPGEFAFGRE